MKTMNTLPVYLPYLINTLFPFHIIMLIVISQPLTVQNALTEG